MNNDLISREALKEAIENITLDKHTMIWITGLREALKCIDNAPAVDYTFEEVFQKTICDNKLYCPSKPQGEWKLYSSCTTGGKLECVHYKCSKCGRKLGYIVPSEKEYNPDMFLREYPFCNCGVKMRMQGGAEE